MYCITEIVYTGTVQYLAISLNSALDVRKRAKKIGYVTRLMLVQPHAQHVQCLWAELMSKRA